MTARCPTCGNQGIDGWHVTRCAYLAGLLKRVEDHAAQCGVAAVAARDLFAHLRAVGDDGEQAMRKALVVLDLGWRPARGSVACGWCGRGIERHDGVWRSMKGSDPYCDARDGHPDGGGSAAHEPDTEANSGEVGEGRDV